MIETKKCAKCAREKMVDDFSLDSTRPSGRAAYCKRCYALQVRSQRMKSHGVTPEQVERVLEAQGGKCACCGENAVTLEPGVRDIRSTMSFVDFRRGWGHPAGVLCYRCMPHVNTVKNNPTTVAYLSGTTLEYAT